ncbi:MAG: hypothetical protein KBD63_06635 [Bacteriovoracaceae bacterium]|nr:hypothetical protein [Bacteriovoracaceae bacterium]
MTSALINQITLRMKEKGFSIRSLEMTLNTKPNAVRHVLDGMTAKPNIYLIEAIAKVLQCTLHDLLNDSAYEETLVAEKIKKTLNFFVKDIVEGRNQEQTSNPERVVSVENIDLLKECFIFVVDRANPDHFDFKKIKNIAYEVYKFSMEKNNQTLDINFAEWEMKKHIK